MLKLIYINSSTISAFEVHYWTGSILLALNLMVLKTTGQMALDIPPKYRLAMVTRVVFGYIGVAGFFIGPKYLPVSVATCLVQTNPIWTALFGFVFLKERITKYDVFSIASAFMGVLIINNPFSSKQKAAISNETDEISLLKDVKVYTTEEKFRGTLISLVGTCGASIAFTCVRYIGKNVHYSLSPFWFSVGNVYFGAMLSVYNFNNSVPTQYS